MIREYTQQPPAFHDYDPQAPVVAQVLIDYILSADNRLRIEHVGSSSVNGCGGKGIIDLLVIYRGEQLEDAKQALAELGFQRQQSRDPFPENRPMRVGSIINNGRTFQIHVHVVSASSPEVEKMLWFRERLRSDTSLIREYEAEKRRILSIGVLDGTEYAERKGDFVQAILERRTRLG